MATAGQVTNADLRAQVQLCLDEIRFLQGRLGRIEAFLRLERREPSVAALAYFGADAKPFDVSPALEALETKINSFGEYLKLTYTPPHSVKVAASWKSQ